MQENAEQRVLEKLKSSDTSMSLDANVLELIRLIAETASHTASRTLYYKLVEIIIDQGEEIKELKDQVGSQYCDGK